jgi:hypothetical protein
VADRCAVLGWAASGGMALTGFPDGPPLASPAASYGLLQRVTAQLAAATREAGTEVRADAAELIAARAAIGGLTRRGQVSAGQAARLLPARDGWCAVSLARPDDVAAVPALLGLLASPRLPPQDAAMTWPVLAAAAREIAADELAGAAQLLGIPAAALPRQPPDASWPPWRSTRVAPASATASLAGAVVADLSAMWAGPLCARLLGLAGARVIKIESPSRPDGARAGSRRFYDWLHQAQESVSLPFATPAGRSLLRQVIAAADVVIESSRPRALASLGVAPDMIAHKPGQVWLAITGHGRDHPDRVAFGDDAAAGGGLVGWAAGDPVFCADAIADPLTGVCGALAVARSLAAGGGELIDLPMRAVAATFAAATADVHGGHQVSADGTVTCLALGRSQPVLPPRAPRPAAAAPALGRDTQAVVARLRAGTLPASGGGAGR